MHFFLVRGRVGIASPSVLPAVAQVDEVTVFTRLTFSNHCSSFEALEQSELREALNQALNSLPEKYRIVLILRDVQQMSIAETAKALGISKESVKTRTSRARLQMRDRLAPGWGGAWRKAPSK